MVQTVLHRYWLKYPKRPIHKWREQFPKRGIWPVGMKALRKYYFEKISMYGKKFSDHPTLMKLSSNKYKTANWNKRLFSQKETKRILADNQFKSFNKLRSEGYLTPIRYNKRVIYYSSDEIQRQLLVRELLISMCDNIRVRDAKLRQKLREIIRARNKRWLKKKKKKLKLLKMKEKEQKEQE